MLKDTNFDYENKTQTKNEKTIAEQAYREQKGPNQTRTLKNERRKLNRRATANQQRQKPPMKSHRTEEPTIKSRKNVRVRPVRLVEMRGSWFSRIPKERKKKKKTTNQAGQQR